MNTMLFRSYSHVFTLFALLPVAAFAQQAEVSGFVKDPSGAVVSGATVTAQNRSTNLKQTTTTNQSGVYSLPPLPAGTYRLIASAPGFDAKVIDDLKLEVAAKLSITVELTVGSANQTVVVDGSGVTINTVDASVSTIVDRQFVENMPLNGRSFQSLMTMVPGVSVVPSQGSSQSGGISVNGQRTESNYFTIDGVSANTGSAAGVNLSYGAGYSGSLPGQTALGTTQSMVSVDALAEFRAMTSTYSAEYGRTPGGQFSFTTRSGTNDYHGSLYNYLRNDKLDASNWFDNANGLPKQATRQNDFGGTFGGPLLLPKIYNGKDRTFFFFSYEGMRLRSPQAAISTEVPTLAIRQQAPAELRPYLNAFPLPNGGLAPDGNAYFTSGYSSPSSLDTTSLRIDHSINANFKIFGRYSHAPSNVVTRSVYGLSERTSQDVKVKTLTLGSTNILTSRLNSDFRFNYTWNDSTSVSAIDDFGGAVPIPVSAVPGSTPDSPTWLYFRIPGARFPTYGLSPSASNQRQFNLVETMNFSWGRHNLKWGVDYRRIFNNVPLPSVYTQIAYFDQATILSNTPGILRVFKTNVDMKPTYDNFSLFVQDEWKATSRLSLSMGLRWDVNPAPHDADGNQPYTVDQITDLKTTKVVPGSPLWKTTYKNFAPRVGIAYHLRQKQGFDTVLRAGAGIFYDMGTALASKGYFYGVGITTTALFNTPFPVTQAQLNAIPPASGNPPYTSVVTAFDPNLKLPYTAQWNFAVEQGLGSMQTLTVNYVGSAGRRLTALLNYYPGALGNPNFVPAPGFYSLAMGLTGNFAKSDYQALQVQWQRRLSHGLQVLASYNWSHSIDTASSNFTLGRLLRGNSDFDLRHNFQAAVSYYIPGHYDNRLASAMLKNWSLDGRLFARSGAPVNVIGSTGIDPGMGANLDYQPNRVSGQPLYLSDPNAPGGTRINPAAFAATAPGIQGNLGRNVVRGLRSVQLDLAVRRSFSLSDRLNLQFRAEAFNLLNRANFGTFYNQLSDPSFGRASMTLNGQLGGLNPLYQVGGPRSMQLALKLQF